MNIQWNVKNYTDNFSFVHQYGEGVTELITKPAGSRVIDLGCGNGALTEKLQQKGFDVQGIELTFRQADALSFQLEEKADVIFSNAVFHWIDADKQESMIENIARQLKIGGELVCEFGGFGCGETVHAALEKNFNEVGLEYPRVFYFPTIGEYAPKLEKYGLKVNYAVLFDRPTEQKGDDGVGDWIRMFVTKPFENMPQKQKEAIIAKTVEDVKPALYMDGKWIVDYVRIRIRAERVS